MKKSMLFIIMLCWSLYFCISVLNGCGVLSVQDTRNIDPWVIKEEEDGWYYNISKRSNMENYEEYAVILGLVDEEMERDELIVPEKLGGYIVKYFGASYSRMAAETKYYKFNAKNVHCLIFNHSVTFMPTVFDNYYGMVIVNCDIYSTETFNYLDTKLMFNLYYIDYNGVGGEVTTYALFWYRDRLIPKPKDPTWEGFVFIGWYTDSEYTREWDFDNDLVPGDMTLYAKWVEQ